MFYTYKVENIAHFNCLIFATLQSKLAKINETHKSYLLKNLKNIPNIN